MVLIAIDGSAQSLESMINTALQNNYQIRIVKNEAEIASNNNALGNSGQLPTVDLSGTYSTSFNNTLQTFSDGSIREGSNAKNTNLNLAALAKWNLFNGFSVYAKKNQLDYLDQLGQINSKFYIEQTISDIASIYCQLVYEKQLLDNLQHSLNISAYRLSIENKRREIGAGTILDYGQALVYYQTDSIRLLEQQNVIQSLNVEINRVLNNSLENPIFISDSGFNIYTLPQKDSLFDQVNRNNSQLEQQHLLELIAETELRLEKANRYPQIDLFAGYQYIKTSSAVGFFSSNKNYGPTFGVNVNFNLYNGGATNRAIVNARINSEISLLTKQQLDQNLKADVLNLFNQHLSVTARIELAKSNVATINKVYAAAEQQLKKGAINGYDFRLTQITLLNSELTLIRLQYTLKSIEINLNRIAGTVITAYL